MITGQADTPETGTPESYTPDAKSSSKTPRDRISPHSHSRSHSHSPDWMSPLNQEKISEISARIELLHGRKKEDEEDEEEEEEEEKEGKEEEKVEGKGEKEIEHTQRPKTNLVG